MTKRFCRMAHALLTEIITKAMTASFLKVALGLALTSIATQAVTIDFNGLAGGSTLTSYTSGAVTFVATTSATSLLVAETPNGTNGLLGGSSTPYSTIRANIAGGAAAVSVDLGDFNQDADTIFLEVFNAANVSLGKATQGLAASFDGMVTLSVEAADISYAVFGSTAPSTFGSSVYADNFTYRVGNAVSAPDAGNTIGLLALSLGLMAWAARSRRTATR